MGTGGIVIDTAIGEWQADEDSKCICIDVTETYEYAIPYTRLGEDWEAHLKGKVWMNSRKVAAFTKLRNEVLSR